jgi:hypothetical protein
LFGLDLAGTLALLTCVIVLLMVTTIYLRIAAIVAVPALVLVAVFVTQIHGTSLARLGTRRLRWIWGQAHGHTSYRTAASAQQRGGQHLPGVLAPLRLLTASDERGGRFGLAWNTHTGHLTATLRCAAASTWLAGADETGSWVANWQTWLASLGYQPMVRAVAVTVETAPAPGTTLQDTIAARIVPCAPADTTALMRELVVRSSDMTANVATSVSITFDPAAPPHRLRDVVAAVAEASRTLTGLESSLGTCGVTVLGRAGTGDLAGTLRTAFDPDARGVVQRALANRGRSFRVTPGTVGPNAADEEWDCYRHDSGMSVTWGWQEAPRQQVTADVLARLLSPGRFTKRVTLVYRPMRAGDAARMLENQVNAAAFRDAYRRAQRRDESARDIADRLQAQRAAAEEAQGAGVVRMSLYVTATVGRGHALQEAVADIEARADQCKIRLRRLYGGQAAGFATTLPVGVLPALGGHR